MPLPCTTPSRPPLSRRAALLLVAVLLLAPQPLRAQFAITFGGEGRDEVVDIDVDAAGNSYVIGEADPEGLDFGPGTPSDLDCDSRVAFLASYDPSGALRFANVLCPDDFINPLDIVVDEAGNSFIAGFFWGPVDFDPGPGTEIRTPAGSDEAFVVSYDAAGDFRFALTYGGTSADTAHGITLDESGNVYVSGYFSETADFDPGPGTEERMSSTNGSTYFASYDPAGALRFVHTFGGPNALGYAIAVGGGGDIFLVGDISNPGDFDPGPGTELRTPDGADTFVAGFDAAGALLFAHTFGGARCCWTGYGVVLDDTDNLYVLGHFEGTADFDPGPGTATRTSNGRADVFVASYDAAGDFRFASTFGSEHRDVGYGLALDEDGNVHVAGGHRSTVDFDPGPGTALRTSQGANDAYVASFAPDGSFRSVDTFGGPSSDIEGRGIALDGSGYRFVTGEFSGTADLDPGPGIDEHIWDGGDGFLVKLAPADAPPPDEPSDEPPVDGPCVADLRITDFDADGQPAGEFVEITNSGAEAAPLGGCSLLVFDPFTEAVTYAEDLSPASLAAGATYTLTPPDGTLPDGPGAVGLFDRTGVAIGTDVTDVLGDRVAAVVYLDEDTIVGQYPSAGKSGGGLAPALRRLADETPSSFALEGNYPNPFNPQTTIRYALAEASDVTLTVIDALGREVRTLVSQSQEAGRYEVRWDGRDASGLPVASGVYLYTLRAGTQTTSKAMLLAK